MRAVERKHTGVGPAPWDTQAVATSGPPRTALTRKTAPVDIRRDGRKKNVGTIDFALRLYQHASTNGLDGLTFNVPGLGRCVMYDLVQEWGVIRDEVSWIELTDKPSKTVWRIGMADAVQQGEETDTPKGRRFAIPLLAYTRVVQQ